MICPHCGSGDHMRYRSPKVKGNAVVRRHLCTACGRVFLSAEIVVQSLDQLKKIQRVKP